MPILLRVLDLYWHLNLGFVTHGKGRLSDQPSHAWLCIYYSAFSSTGNQVPFLYRAEHLWRVSISVKPINNLYATLLLIHVEVKGVGRATNKSRCLPTFAKLTGKVYLGLACSDDWCQLMPLHIGHAPIVVTDVYKLGRL